jgi:anthraniloyl-CoA monooxygenase
LKVNIIGAGPAGLYLAILLKRIDPSHEINIVERNAPDATFGWGVVFSEETLGALRDADLESYLAITETFATWNAIHIHYQDRLLRSRGHAFSAISRKTLLAILQRRARELGVSLQFGVEVDDLEPYRDADLLVGADGVKSIVRTAYKDAFGPRLTTYPSRFVWFGTDLVFDAFTFIFREVPEGMIQVHGYPFDATTSTFIVECNEETFQRLGLDEMDEQKATDFGEKLFAKELGGHKLLLNRSIWQSFIEVRNQTWHHENVVILGDAAHTAHFSIGSGTKLAMESAVALANAFVRHRGALDPALVDYEMERQPVVERFQEAARVSAEYFETVGRYSRFHPMQFAFNLLTRSGRINYTNLTLRDPGFVRELDAWFSASGNGGHAAPGKIAVPPMFTPLAIGATELSNRVVRSPAGESASGDGTPSEEDAAAIQEAALSGAGLVLTSLVATSRQGRVTARTPTIDGDEQQQKWTGIVKDVHATGARAALLLGHAGRRGATRPHEEGVDLPLHEGAWPLMSASALPYTKRSTVPRAMDAKDMETVIHQFADAAGRAAQAGFDVLEVDAGLGYLLASFLSPLANLRDDQYGGELENRLRFPLAVVDAVRAAWPAERVLAVRLSADDCAKNGSGPDEAALIARAFAEHGCDLVHVVAGQTVPEASPAYRRAYLTPLAGAIRSRAVVRTLVGGFVTTADEVNTAVGAGRVDLCLIEPPARLAAAEAVLA